MKIYFYIRPQNVLEWLWSIDSEDIKDYIKKFPRLSGRDRF